MFISIFKRHRYIRFLEQMQMIDELFKKSFKIAVNQKWVCGSFLISTAGTFAFFILTTLMFNQKRNFLLLHMILAIVVTVMTLSFVSCVASVFIRAYNLKVKLMKTLRTPPEILQTMFKTKSQMCVEVLKYTKIHKALTTSVGDINEVYGFSLVLSFAHDFVLLAALIFMMFYLTFYEGFDASKESIIYYCIWCVPDIFRLTLTCLTCHLTKNEVNFSSISAESTLFNLFSTPDRHLLTLPP